VGSNALAACCCLNQDPAVDAIMTPLRAKLQQLDNWVDAWRIWQYYRNLLGYLYIGLCAGSSGS